MKIVRLTLTGNAHEIYVNFFRVTDFCAELDGSGTLITFGADYEFSVRESPEEILRML